jgi:DNA-directed RNA polymerase subunit RPC12/RpoP
LSAKKRWELHSLAASLGLFTHSKGPHTARILHVYRSKPAGWVPHVPKTRAFNEFVGEREQLWAGGDREYIGDCAECGVELWGYDEERVDDDDDKDAELFCQRCGGDTLSKWELIR